MKRCPNCQRSYTDEALNFCLEDGTPLVNEASIPQDNAETRRYGAQPTELYRPAPPPQQPPRMVNQAPAYPGQWSPLPPPPQARKSTAVWWIFGVLAVVVVLGIGIVVVLLAVASISSQSNSNRVLLNNTNSNRNANSNQSTNTNATRENSNTTSTLPASFSDDFSETKWPVTSSDYGQLWYDNDEYHMRSKDKTYVVMYGPSNDYNTENADVQVTARSVDGISPDSGYGLIVHGEKSKDENLEDYAFIIFTGPNPQYKVLMHKGGVETKMVDWTPSSTIRKGTSTNQLEVKISGTQLAFLINGQLVTTISDTANFKRGRAGLYTSDAHEVAFDDLEISR
jgi:type II secretory pathway pseudopilin PulG